MTSLKWIQDRETVLDHSPLINPLRLGKFIRMNRRPFPKPPSADVLPLEIWLDQTDRAEVGREPFFRGRDAEFDVFRRAASSLHAGRVGGGTMIFQGAPGAGKSALMAECIEAVRRHSTPEAPWVAATIKPETLKSSVDVMMLLVEAVNEEGERLSKRAPGSMTRQLEGLLELGRRLYGELSERGVGVAGVSIGGKFEAETSGETNMLSERVFRNAAPLLENLHLVVLVDEAQNMPVGSATRGVVDCLHNPPGAIPLVAAFFGLSDTQDVLRQCGLSRFADERVVNLEPLADEDTACAIRDAFAAYGFTGTAEVKRVWVDRLTGLSQGWPQHINRVIVAAARLIRDNGGRIERHLLEQALAQGKERKEAYYAGRLDAGSSRAWVYRQLALAAEKKDGVLSYDEIESLTDDARSTTGETLDDFLTSALHAGLLAPARNRPDCYTIPIPSFGAYLRALPVEPPQP